MIFPCLCLDHRAGSGEPKWCGSDSIWIHITNFPSHEIWISWTWNLVVGSCGSCKRRKKRRRDFKHPPPRSMLYFFTIFLIIGGLSKLESNELQWREREHKAQMAIFKLQEECVLMRSLLLKKECQEKGIGIGYKFLYNYFKKKIKYQKVTKLLNTGKIYLFRSGSSSIIHFYKTWYIY